MAGIFRYNTSSSTPIRRHTTLSPFGTSPGQLQDVTMDNSYAIGYRSPCHSLQYGGGAVSPGQGRSVREFEEQMTALRKENFNLKLRIYFLEEKIPGYNPSNNQQQQQDGHETLLKQNVDLKVDNEVLRKELQEKHILLCEAGKAMELMEQQQKSAEEQSQAIIDELNEKIRYLESEIRELEKPNDKNHEILTLDDLFANNEFKNNVDDINKIRELETSLKQYEVRNGELSIKIKEMDVMINEKDLKINELETKIKQIQYQNSELQEQLDLMQQQNINNMDYQKLKDQLVECKKELADKTCTLDDIETELQQKSKENEKAHKVIQKLLMKINQLEQEKLCQTDTSTVSQENAQALHLKSLSDTDIGSIEMRNKLEKLVEEKDNEIKKLKLDIKKKTANLQTLVNKELWDKNREIERLTKLFNRTQSNTISSIPCSPIKEIDNINQLAQSFTESDYNAALERNKSLQKKIDTLYQRLLNVTENQNTEQQIVQLQILLQETEENAKKSDQWRKEYEDVCQVLKTRLEELAGFLDSLLTDEILGALATDKGKAMRKAVSQSLEMSRSLNMSLSKSRLLSLGGVDDLTRMNSSISAFSFMSTDHNKENESNQSNLLVSIDERMMSFTQNQMIIENLRSEIKSLKKELENRNKKSTTITNVIDSTKKERRSLPIHLIENQSESEAWSEPDRNVSLARIGLESSTAAAATGAITVTGNDIKCTTTESELGRSKSKSNNSKLMKKITSLEQTLTERDNQIVQIQCQLIEIDNRLKEKNLHLIEINRELDDYKKVNEILEIEIAKLKNQEQNNSKYDELKYENETIKRQLNEKQCNFERIQRDRDDLNIEIRLCNMKIEALQNDIENLKLQHKKDMENLLAEEHKKLCKLQNELHNEYEKKLKEQEQRYQDTLARDWVSRSMYSELKNDLERIQKQFTEAQSTIEFLNENEIELNAQLMENEKSIRSLKKNLDDATLQASKAALERTKAINDRKHYEIKYNELNEKFEIIEKEKFELISRLAQMEKSNAILQTKLMNNNAKGKRQPSSSSSSSFGTGGTGSEGYTSEDVPQMASTSTGGQQRLNNSSPDLGIESDAGGRTSSLASAHSAKLVKTNDIINNDQPKTIVNDDVVNKNSNNDDGDNGSTVTSKTTTITVIKHDCAKVDKENAELRRNLKHTKLMLENTWSKLKAANQRKENIERDLRQQIQKTQKVLSNVRTNLENEMEHKPAKK